MNHRVWLLTLLLLALSMASCRLVEEPLVVVPVDYRDVWVGNYDTELRITYRDMNTPQHTDTIRRTVGVEKYFLHQLDVSIAGYSVHFHPGIDSAGTISYFQTNSSHDSNYYGDGYIIGDSLHLLQWTGGVTYQSDYWFMGKRLR